MFSSLDNFEYNLYANPDHTPHYVDPHPTIVNSIEFMDLTAPQHEDRRRRRSTTTQDKESISNMRIVSPDRQDQSSVTNDPNLSPQRRRAQNRASQRAFRERKEKHVQHLEQELETLETKHRTLTKSYTELDSTHAILKQEVQQLRSELQNLKSSRESSVAEIAQPSIFDRFAAEGLFETGQDISFW